MYNMCIKPGILRFQIWKRNQTSLIPPQLQNHLRMIVILKMTRFISELSDFLQFPAIFLFLSLSAPQNLNMCPDLNWDIR